MHHTVRVPISIVVTMLTEIACQLSELNENLRKLANPLVITAGDLDRSAVDDAVKNSPSKIKLCRREITEEEWKACMERFLDGLKANG